MDVDVFVTCALLHGLADQLGGNGYEDIAAIFEELGNTIAEYQPGAKVEYGYKGAVSVPGREVNGGRG